MTAGRWIAWLGIFSFAACAHRPAPAPPPDRITRIQRIAVEGFEGSPVDIRGEFVRALKGGGLNIVDRKQAPQALLSGNLTNYKPGRKMIIVIGKGRVALPGNQTAVVSNPVISLGGSQAPNPALTLNNPQMVAENGVVGIAAQLRDIPGGTVLWAGEFSYEALNISDALPVVIQHLVHSLQLAAPRLQHREPAAKKG